MRRDVLPRESPRDAETSARSVSRSTNAEGDDARGGNLCVATLCGANERASSGYACVPCEGGPPTTPATTPRARDVLRVRREPTRQRPNERACPNGETRSAGDPVPGLDTTCSAFACAANERVFNQACIACPDGSANDAGDDVGQGHVVCLRGEPPRDRHRNVRGVSGGNGSGRG